LLERSTHFSTRSQPPKLSPRHHQSKTGFADGAKKARQLKSDWDEWRAIARSKERRTRRHDFETRDRGSHQTLRSWPRPVPEGISASVVISACCVLKPSIPASGPVPRWSSPAAKPHAAPTVSGSCLPSVVDPHRRFGCGVEPSERPRQKLLAFRLAGCSRKDTASRRSFPRRTAQFPWRFLAIWF
jgi:hypothetical protein